MICVQHVLDKEDLRRDKDLDKEDLKPISDTWP